MRTNDINPQIVEIMRAMHSPDRWKVYKRDQARNIAGKIEKNKSEQFAEYMEMSFISICDELHVFEMARDWPKKSESEKLAIAGNIIRRFVERVQSDIKSGRAKKYNDTVIDNVPKISVTRATNGLMSVSSNGNVNINPNWTFYNDLTRF